MDRMKTEQAEECSSFSVFAMNPTTLKPQCLAGQPDSGPFKVFDISSAKIIENQLIT